MKVPPGHTLVVNPHTDLSSEKNKMAKSLFGRPPVRNPGAKDLAMTGAEVLGIGALAAGANLLVAKLATPPVDPTKKAILRGHAVGLSQVAVGVAGGLALDQFAGRRDVAVGVGSALAGLGFRDEWAYMQAQKALAAAQQQQAPAAQTPASTPAAAGATGFSRGLPAGATVPANPYAAYYR